MIHSWRRRSWLLLSAEFRNSIVARKSEGVSVPSSRGTSKFSSRIEKGRRLGFQAIADPDNSSAVGQRGDFPGFHPTIRATFPVAFEMRAKARKALLAFGKADRV